MTDAAARDTPELAHTVFGEALRSAERYWSWLAGAGLTRGLMGPRETPRLWDRHILNCAVVGQIITPAETVVDIGSGAGLPGIPLAIARPDLRITLVEPLLRRATFLEEVVADLGLDVRVVRGRAEETTVIDQVGEADVVTSRAVAPLDRLAKWSTPLARNGGRLIALKGTSAADEIEMHGSAVARCGLTDLVVQECGAGLLPVPTVVVVGRKTDAGMSKRARRVAARDRRSTEVRRK